MKWIFNAPCPLFRQLIFLQGFVFLLSSTEMYLNCKMKKCLGNRGLIQEVLHFVIKLVVYTERKPISVHFLILNSSEHNPKNWPDSADLCTWCHSAYVDDRQQPCKQENNNKILFMGYIFIFIRVFVVRVFGVSIFKVVVLATTCTMNKLALYSMQHEWLNNFAVFCSVQKMLFSSHKHTCRS